MKTNSSVMAVIGILALQLSACGSESPFSRGKQRDSVLDGGAGTPLALSRAAYEQTIKGHLMTCGGCHANPVGTFEAAAAKVTVGAPERSELYLRASGRGHRKVLSDQQLQDLSTWILGEPVVAPTPVTTVAPNPAPSAPPVLQPMPPVQPPASGNQREELYMTTVQPLLAKDCAKCHDNPGETYAAGRALIVPKKPQESELWLRASGTKLHRKVWKDGTEQLSKLEAWINAEE